MNLDRKTCLRIGGSLFLLFLCIYYWNAAEQGISILISAAMPLIIGAATAYVLNILMSFYERHYFIRLAQNRLVQSSKRGVCLVAALLTLAGILALVGGLVIPELMMAVKFLLAEIPPAVKELLANEDIARFLTEEQRMALAEFDWKAAFDKASAFLVSGLGDAAGAVIGMISSAFSSAISIFTGFIFSLYLLLSRDTLQSQGLRLMRAFLPEKWHHKTLRVFSVFNLSFHRYIVGQCTEAVILGSLCALGMIIFAFPYAGMIGALIGVTALIPIAGAYIGAGVGAIMMLTISPLKALLFLIFIVVLQQIEGNLIYPRVVGKSIGLPALWVMAAVTIGGGLMGILGMLLGVPIASALYQLVRLAIQEREKQSAS